MTSTETLASFTYSLSKISALKHQLLEILVSCDEIAVLLRRSVHTRAERF